MAKSKPNALYAIGTVTVGVTDGDEKTSVSFDDGKEIKGVDLDEKEIQWLIDNGAARKGEAGEETPAEEAAPAADAAP